MKSFICLLLTCCSLPLLAEDHIKAMYNYTVLYESDSTMSTTETSVLISCHFTNTDVLENPAVLRFGINGSDETGNLNSALELRLALTEARYRFQFFYSSTYQEIETDSIEVKPGVVTHIHLYFQNQLIQQSLKKPVIYCYPETPVALSVQLKTNGELTFAYPSMNDNTWNVTAQPNGDLTVKGASYPYLFWEAQLTVNNPFDLAHFNGFIVEGKDALTFLEDKLTFLGLNDRERTDFITFWGPQLAVNQHNYVQFQLNEACDQYAELTINPAPNNLNRVYMIWSKVSSPMIDEIFVPQILFPLDRSGFDVLEWGGVEIVNDEL